MGHAWSVERVEATAPDQASVNAARKLAGPGPWNDTGITGDLLWGACQGSGSTPYRTVVDTASPVFSCSCPSRKRPCKHVLALLLLWAQGQVQDTGEIAPFAAAWADARKARAAKAAAKAAAAATPQERDEQKASATTRAAQRDARVSAGMAELDRFLADQVREGLATRAADRPQRLERMAARMVDAQAPGVATRLRELAILPSTGNWPTRVLDEYGSLHLLAAAWAGRDRLPADLVETVRAHIGFTITSDDVRATPGVPDRWAVLGRRDTCEGKMSVRRVWLWGRETGARALVLSYAHGDAPLDTSLLPGTEIDADLHFYPGRLRLRALVGDRRAETTTSTGWDPLGGSVDAAAAQLREAVAADPWCETWPVAIHGHLTWQGRAWLAAERAVPLLGRTYDAKQLLAQAGTGPTTVFGELSADGLLPLAFLDDGTVRPL